MDDVVDRTRRITFLAADEEKEETGLNVSQCPRVWPSFS